MEREFITLLTDFGLEDDFAGTCHGVIKRIAPDADIIHVTHGIEPQNVLQGALVLANTLPYMPVGIHVAVVDPGVGGSRKALAVRGGDGRRYVGPDNGLLLVAADKLGGVAEAVEITNRDFFLEPVSATFHGRDVFSPAAAHLARGVALAELGPATPPADLERIDVPRPAIANGTITASVVYIDRFGNVQLNLASEHLEQVGIAPGGRVEIEISFDRYFAVSARTFADVRPGEVVVYEDAYRNIALAINRGRAADIFSARVGEQVTLARADE